MATAKYKISEADYIDALKLFSKPTTLRLGILLAIGATFLAIATLSSDDTRAIGIGGLAGIVVVALLNRFLLTALIAKRNYRNYKAIHEEFEAELTDDGIKLSSRNGNSIIRIEQMQKWRENEKYILIYPMPRIFHMIPKDLETQGFNVSLLREKLTNCLGRAK